MPRCDKCREFYFSDRHVCPPQFRVWPDHYDEDDGWLIYAADAKTAATKWADLYDSDGDYTIVNGSPETVTVRQIGEHETTRFEVFGEAQPVYYAEPADPAPPPEEASCES